ncbi:MAG TPA: adenylate/guanylate cyclase domain-containing protein, partial [Roseiflexaceae bacterium]|nr:adenylate/guanylate cyclase domain-containing protein [Roseiflexaceae bacterium]
RQPTISIATPQRRDFRPGLIFKITLPYLVVALALALATTYVIATLQASSVATAFSRQIDETRIRVADQVVRTEQAQLANVRTLARLSGLPEAIQAGDSATVLELVIPYAISQNIERIVVLDGRGIVRGMVHVRNATAETNLPAAHVGDWPVVADVLRGASDDQGDKYIALLDDDGTSVLYTITPLFLGERQVGALLAGTTVRTLVEHWRAATLADVTLYGADGTPLATSFGADKPQELAAEVGNQLPFARAVSLGSRDYQEVITRLVLRNTPTAQFIGVALSTSGQVELQQKWQLLLLDIFGGGIVIVLLLGIAISRRITRPITALVAASERVSAGDLDHELPILSQDETGALTKSFNAMIAGLRERERMHDILGRFVSPTVARLVLSKPLDLRGETKELTILFTDLRDFTAMAEEQDPAIVIDGLNAYFQIVVEAADRYGGIVNKFGGDSTLAVFGLADEQANVQRSAEAALRAALDIRQGMQALNEQRAHERLPLLAAGIGINTGSVVAGLIGTERRMEYTVIGDAVNLTARIQTLNRKLKSDILISDATYAALGEVENLAVVNYGWRRVKGKRE